MRWSVLQIGVGAAILGNRLKKKKIYQKYTKMYSYFSNILG